MLRISLKENAGVLGFWGLGFRVSVVQVLRFGVPDAVQLRASSWCFLVLGFIQTEQQDDNS